MQRLLHQTTFYWFPVAGWAFLIFSLSSVPAEKLPRWEIPYLDKAVHGVEFGILALLLCRAFTHSFPRRPVLLYWGLSLLTALLYALSDEWHQSLVPGRHPNPWDLLADSLGILLFLILPLKSAKK